MIDPFIALFVFMLAAFTGHEIISRVPVILHTADVRIQFRARHRAGGRDDCPGARRDPLAQAIGFAGVVLGAGNAAGGYVVTERMLEMFKSSKDKKD